MHRRRRRSGAAWEMAKRVRRQKLHERAYWQRLFAALGLWAIMGGIMYVMIYPLLQIVSTSLKNYPDMLNPMCVWLPRSFSVSNYSRAFTAMGYAGVLKNTLLIVCVAPIAQLISCGLAGYGFARFKFREKGALFALLLLSLLVPQQTIVLPQYLLFRSLGTINTYWPVILPSVLGQGLKSALFVFIFRQFFRGLPKELEDAAYIDGCGFSRTFLVIMAPNAVPAALAVFLFSFVWHYNDIYTISMFTTRADLHTLSIRLVNIMNYLVEPGIVRDVVQYVPVKYAGVFLAILPIMLVYLFGQKFFVEGVERSGIVG